MRTVKIGNSWVGGKNPVYIIAEAGSNHNGNFEQALRLIDVAAEAGANAVKFQTFRAESLYPPNAGRSDYLGLPRSIYEIIHDMEMPVDWIPRLCERCRNCGVDFLSTPFDECAADILFEHVPAYKIASYDLTHHPLVRHIACKGKPVIASTGAANLAEIRDMVNAFRATGNDQLILMQCTAKYPAPLTALNLKALVLLREEFGVPSGLSDHSREAIPGPLAAVALGASVIEKHFTLSNRLPGPDHAFAVEPAELADMIRQVRQVECALGSGIKEPLPEEEELREFARRTIFSIRTIAAEETLSAGNIAVLRCGKLGHGLPPAELPRLLGRRAAREIPAYTPIKCEDLSQ
jgi:N-acetylneuraminate synthase